MKIPFQDYVRRYQNDRQFVGQAIAEVARSGEFILKAKVLQLEETVANLVEKSFCVAVGSGSHGMYLGLQALGAGPGTEVITPAFSFISTASTSALLGARPRFVDVDVATGTVTEEQLPKSLSPNVKGFMAVHLFCSLANMPEIENYTRRNGLFLIEDAAVALGSTLANNWAGTYGDLGVYSFFPAKPLGGIGEGGVIVTDNEDVALRCRMLRNHGQDGKTRFLHHLVGYNLRMDDITALYAARQISRRDELIQRRQEIIQAYDAAFGKLSPMVIPLYSGAPERGCYNYAIRVPEREKFQAFLKTYGIETQVFYETPLPYQPAFKFLGHKPGEFPNAERLGREIVCLPLFPELVATEVEYIIQIVKSFCGAENADQVVRNF